MSSPFASRLGTNYCPTDQEVLEIRSLLVQPTLRIKSLDDEIAILQKSIDKLVKERVNLASYVEAHSALISPVRRLPLDVIENIFVACLPTRRNCVMSATEAPILLGRICSAWRTISLTTPRLWASLHIVEPPSAGSTVHTHKMTQRLNNAKTWLGRSGQCPLSISLQCAREDRATTQFIQAVIPFAARWQHIQFTIPPALIFEIMSNIDIDMPCLESIALHCEHFPWMQVKVGSFNMLQGARLSSLSFPANFFAVGRLSLRWNQLTALTIGEPEPGCTIETLLSVLPSCSELRSCKLLLRCHDAALPLVEHPIVELRFLHTLALRCVEVTPAAWVLLKRLSLPELSKFVLLGTRGENTGCSMLADFFARSIRLESFEIGDSTFSLDSLQETLRTLPPTIQELRIHNLPGGWQELDDSVLEVLATSGLCLTLRNLTIERGSKISDDAILQFVTARMLEFGTPVLQRVEIHFDRKVILDVVPSLQPFFDTGLIVSLDYSPPAPKGLSPWDGLEDNPDSSVWARRPRNYW